ncbi:MAG: cytochrome C [Planctomycetota bacterium]|nr:MAG: cytochrome C [Planctomycetota bacterium]
MDRFQFPKWTNQLRHVLGVVMLGGPIYLVLVFGLGASPSTMNVGYAPEQPVPFSHKLHAGDLGLDCRYCHTSVEKGAFAALPPTQTCMNCHERIKTDSPQLAPVRKSWETGASIPWVKVHDLPQYAFFDHSAHVTRGIGCASCHGRVDTMEVVQTVSPLSMGWCLDCHRNPEKHLRPRDQITNMSWDPVRDAGKTQEELGLELKTKWDIKPQTSCSTCHR